MEHGTARARGEGKLGVRLCDVILAEKTGTGARRRRAPWYNTQKCLFLEGCVNPNFWLPLAASECFTQPLREKYALAVHTNLTIYC